MALVCFPDMINGLIIGQNGLYQIFMAKHAETNFCCKNCAVILEIVKMMSPTRLVEDEQRPGEKSIVSVGKAHEKFAFGLQVILSHFNKCPQSQVLLGPVLIQV